jgi:hypothetical protein
MPNDINDVVIMSEKWLQKSNGEEDEPLRQSHSIVQSFERAIKYMQEDSTLLDSMGMNHTSRHWPFDPHHGTFFTTPGTNMSIRCH